MKAYKATNNFKCRDLTYEVGQTYTMSSKPLVCVRGFHFCEKMEDTLKYYPPSLDHVLLEIEILGEVDNTIVHRDKGATNSFKVLRVVPEEEHNLFKTIGDQIEYGNETKFVLKFDENGKNNYIRRSCPESGKILKETWFKFDDRDNIVHVKVQDYKNNQKDERWYEHDKHGNITRMTYPDGHGYIYKNGKLVDSFPGNKVSS